MTTAETTPPVERPRFPFGCLIVAAIAATPAVLVLIQRDLTYRDCSRNGMFSGDMIPLSIWLMVGLVLISLARPWKPRPRLARGLLIGGGLAALQGLGIMILLLWHHLRYDPKTEQFTTPEDEAVWGRAWPLGLHEKHFIYAFMRDTY